MNTFSLGLRERKKQATRRAILEAARELFVAEGFGETTMARIAEAADVSVGSLYNYFANKNALLLGMFADMTADMLDEGRAIVDGEHDDARVAVLQLLELYLGYTTDLDKTLLREVMAVSFSQSPEVIKEFTDLDMMLTEQLGALVGRLQAAGLITTELALEDISLSLYGALAVSLFMFLGIAEADDAMLKGTLRQQVAVTFHGLYP